MSRLKLISFFVLLSFGLKSQVLVNRSPSSVQVRDARLQAYLNLIAPRYSDTTHANTNKGLDSLGAIIYDSTSNNFYFRGVNATMGHKWIAFGSGGGGTDWYTTDGSFTSTRTADLNNKLVQFTSTGTNTTSEFDINITNSTFNTSTFFSRGIGSGQMYSSSTASINGFNDNTTYAEIYGSNAAVTHTNRIRTYQDSMVFNSYNGLYRFRNAVTSTDTTTYKPLALDAFGNLVQISSWNNGRPLYARNALRARNDSTITWNGLLDTPTVISGSALYTLKFSGISGGVKFDENPTFNTTSTTGYVWTAANSSGLGAWQAAPSGILTRQNITSGTSATVTGGNYLVTVDPSSTIAAYTLTMPSSANDQDIVEVDFGGTLTSGIVVTAFTILPNSGQTILDNTPPGSPMVDNTLKYVYRASTAAWRRIKL